MAIQTIQPDVQPAAFPQDLPPRQTQSLKDRNCPNMRTCWSFSFASYDFTHAPDTQTRFRRIAMITILALRVAMSALSIWSAVTSMQIATIVVYSILAVLGTWSIAWCLSVIGDAVGERRVLGKLIGRMQFDWFLCACAIIHAGLVVAYFFGLGGLGLQLTWLVMWLAIFAAAWIAGWPPEYPQNNV